MNKKDAAFNKTKTLEITDVDNNSNMSTTNQAANLGKKVEWSEENEMIMIEWCDVAQCYKWLNTRANAKYSYMHAWFTIPAIILSTISGTASFAQTSLPSAYQVYAPMAIGSLNIFIGILTTIQQYLKISELNEAHRVAAISWDKFSRNIRIELAKKPAERMDAGTFLKICRQEFDRLMETSPMISPSVIGEFNSTFLGKVGTIERARFEKLKKPDICNILISAEETRHQWTKEELKLEDPEENPIDYELEVLGKDEKIKQLQAALKKKYIEEQRKTQEEEKRELDEQQKKAEREKEAADRVRYLKETEERNRQHIASQFELLDDFSTKFSDACGRPPLTDEIISHAQELGDEIENGVLQQYLDKILSIDQLPV